MVARFTAAITGARVPHAVLIHEDPGSGGSLLAGWIAQRLLCSGPEPRPCGTCVDCRNVSAVQHPDLIVRSPGEDSAQIRVDDIRELSAELALTSHRGGYKIAVVRPAEAMNVLAANALLKTLEEPPRQTLLILVAAQPSRLPATIRSRCLTLRVAAPAQAVALEWLARGNPADYSGAMRVMGNAPLLLQGVDPREIEKELAETAGALEEIARGHGDPVATAERWAKGDLPLRLACLETWLTDRIRSAADVPQYSDKMRGPAHLPAPVSGLNMQRLFELHDGVRELKALADTPVNKSVALERWLWHLAAVTGTRKPPVTATRDMRRS